MEANLKLKQKLDEFIWRYYLNQLVRGVLLFVGLFISYFLLVSFAEYFGHFGSTVRTVLFYSIVFLAFGFFYNWILLPLLKLGGIGKRISHLDAARLIGGHFSEIDDKLVNTLQLASEGKVNPATHALLLASINQRMLSMRPIPFATAIDLTENKKHLKYVLPPLLLLVVLFVVYPSLITESTVRLVDHTSSFEKKAPFLFVFKNENEKAIQNEDVRLMLEVTGSEVPAEVYVEMEDGRFRMQRLDNGAYGYTIRQIQSQTSLRFYGGGFYSKEHTIEVLPRPVVGNFQVELNYPAYLGKTNEMLENAGDLLIPVGTVVKWVFDTRHTEDLLLQFTDANLPCDRQTENRFVASKRFMGSSEYSVISENATSGLSDSIHYNITVVPDLYPTISVQEVQDSMVLYRLYFNGSARDDHGLSKLEFHFQKKSDENTELSHESLSIERGISQSNFYHSWDMTTLGLEPGEEVSYYFEVWDNDAVNGAKSAKTQPKTFRIPSLDELAQKNEEKSEAIKDNLEEAIEDAKKIRKDLEEMQRKMLEKKKPDWEDKQMFSELMERQKELQSKVESIKQQNQEKNKQKNQFNKSEERVVEKQQQLEKLFENVMSEEMKELFKKMEALMEEMNKDKAQELLEDMEFSNEDLEKELDRSLELFKQLEFEQKLEETKDKLEKLAEKQEKLSEESKDGEKESEELKEEQEKLNEEFDDVKKDLDDLEKKNEELEKPNEMEDMKEEEQAVDEEQEDSKKSLEKDQKKQAAKSQKSASEKMKEMAKKMGNMMMSMQSQGQEEDLEALRQIIENLLTLSFDQEELIANLKGIKRNDPKYVDAAREQQKLHQDTKIIEDSLYALSKRVVQIETIVNREIRSVNQNMQKSMSMMADRKTPQALTRQQLALTSVNNLALLLSEVVERMQQQMNSMMSGSGSCSKPGGQGKKPSAGGMKKMQAELNKQMEKMKKAMEKGKKPGKKPGEKPGQGGKGGMSGKEMSKGLAKMAAQQEALRNMVQQYENNLKNEGGKGNAGTDLKDLSKLMEQTENDVVNKMITQETLRRQQDIMTRLLKAEKAEREREKEERRESQEAKDPPSGNPEGYFEYKLRKKKETELLRTIPPNLTPFYRGKVDEYFANPVD